MKIGAAAIALILSGCGNAVPWVRPPEVSASTCTAACEAHFDQCPQIFAQFPERGAIECPAEHRTCLKACANAQEPARASAAPAALPPPASATPATLPAPPPAPATPATLPAAPAAATGVVRAAGSKEARLRELKHFYDEGLVTDDVYRDRQKAILAEP